MKFTRTIKERLFIVEAKEAYQKEAEDLVQALSERPQAIIAENCTQDERENAQQYFNYLGLDVIVRQSMELQVSEDEGKNEEAALKRLRRMWQQRNVPSAISILPVQPSKSSSVNVLSGRKRWRLSIKNKLKSLTNCNLKKSGKKS